MPHIVRFPTAMRPYPRFDSRVAGSGEDPATSYQLCCAGPAFVGAEDIDHGRLAIKAFEKTYGAKHPKVVAKIVDAADVLLEFYRYPAEHLIHLRTTNPIESTFATACSRTKVTKGPGSRGSGIAMAFKPIEAAQNRRRAVNAPHLVALVRAGACFERGVLVGREEATAT